MRTTLQGFDPEFPIQIYALIEPTTGETRYIGQSSSPRSRLSSHRGRFGSAPKVREWLLDLRDAGTEPIIETLRRVIADDADEAELDEIELAVMAGARLLNTRHVPRLNQFLGWRHS